MSPPNRSEGSRRAYARIYGAAEMQYAAPQEAMRTDTVRAGMERLSALSVSQSNSVLYDVFVWARRALKCLTRRFPARAGRRGGAVLPL